MVVESDYVFGAMYRALFLFRCLIPWPWRNLMCPQYQMLFYWFNSLRLAFCNFRFLFFVFRFSLIFLVIISRVRDTQTWTCQIIEAERKKSVVRLNWLLEFYNLLLEYYSMNSEWRNENGNSWALPFLILVNIDFKCRAMGRSFDFE